MYAESTLAMLNWDDPETHEQPQKLTAAEWQEQLFLPAAPQDQWYITFPEEHQLDDATGTNAWQGGW